MDRAYDSLLDMVVYASEADPGYRYRYKCLCCKEYVLVAAAAQRKQTIHFRHSRGSEKHKDCENYVNSNWLPDNPQALGAVRGSNVSFYFAIKGERLFVSVRLSKDEIEQYELRGVNYELGDSPNGSFYSCLITSISFSPEIATEFDIFRFSPVYYCGVASKQKQSYALFRNGKVAVFKVLGDVFGDWSAKAVMGDELFTNTNYFILSKDDDFTSRLHNSQNLTILREAPEIVTAGQEVFTGIVLAFKGRDAELCQLLKELGLRLNPTETLTLIWPPIMRTDTGYIATFGDVFVSSSFRIKARSNTNATEFDILQISDNLTRISLTKQTKIFYKNAEMSITCVGETSQAPHAMRVEQQEAEEIFKVPDDGEYYLRSTYGIRRLANGEKVFLRPGDVVQLYRQTYILSTYTAKERKTTVDKVSLLDVLSNYKVVVPYEESMLKNIELSGEIEEYLEECRKSGLINRAVVRMLLEGRL